MTHRIQTITRTTGFVALALSLASCQDTIGTDNQVEIGAYGAVEGAAFVDLNGNEIRDGGDEAYPNLRLLLRTAGGGGTVRSATTDVLGEFTLDSVPVGSFELVLDPATAPDTVDISGLSEDELLVLADSTVNVEVRASFPTYTLAEVRGLAPGIRVRTHGIALNQRRPDGDGVVHLLEEDVYLRATAVEREDIFAGDSVRFIGRTATDAGQPILTDVRPFRLVSQARFLEPILLSSAEARAAQGGALDAALIQVRDALVLDTVRVAGNLVVTADDGSGPVDLVIRNFLGYNTAALRPDSTYFPAVTGLLVPTLTAPSPTPAPPALQVGSATVAWRMTPRASGDANASAVPILGSGQLCVVFPHFAFPTFADPLFETRVRSALGVGAMAVIRCSTLANANLMNLSAPGLGIQSVAGVQNLVDLRSLTLTSNQLTSVGPIAELPVLEELRLGTNFISNIGPLSALGGLRVLVLTNNLVTSLNALEELTQLIELRLGGNAVSDVGPLAGLNLLEKLDLSSNQITNVAALGGLFGLTELSLAGNAGLVNIQPLLNNPGLGAGDTVDLTGTAVACGDVTALRAKGVTVTSACP